MSSVKSRVKRALSDEQTTSESKQTGTSTSQAQGGAGTLSGEELTKAVKEGLTEALEERSQMQQEAEMTSTEESTEESESSRRGPSLKRMMLLGALVTIGILARRRLQSRGSGGYDSGSSDEPSP